VRAYADSSYILRLVTLEAESEHAMAEYRRLGYPPLFFSSLHALEVQNAIRQRAFHQRRSISSGERRHVARERDPALARLEHLLSRRVLLVVALDMEAATTRAAKLSAAHTERLGARAIDLLQVAGALTLECELFLTTDARQAQLAKAEGLKVVTAIPAG
jgi:predicted nucleic acid-binding protein